MSRPDSTFGDPDIRSALRSRLLRDHGGEPSTVIVEELGVCRGQARIDIAVVNGTMHGYEIKSDRDSLRRLSGQIGFYSRVLDRATLVAGDRHLTHAQHVVPRWWGVLRIVAGSEKPQFTTVRRGRKNPERNPRFLVELLWLEDALALLEQRGAARGVRGKPRQVVWDRVCEYFTVDEIAAAVCFQLKARATLRDP